MDKITFKNKGETGAVPINSTNLNLLQDNVENAIVEVNTIGETDLSSYLEESTSNKYLTYKDSNGNQKVFNGVIPRYENSQIIEITRSSSSESGDVSYTGVGFKPSRLVVLAVSDGTLYNSIGISDKDKNCKCIYQSSDNTYHINSKNLITYSNYSGWAQNATVKSYDDDGFTLTWAKIGTPVTGNISIIILCE